MEKRNHIGELKGGDYTITSNGNVVIACPVDGKIAYIVDDRNQVRSVDPLTIDRAFKMPCYWQHWFRVTDGFMESSIYSWGESLPDNYTQKRYPLQGFDPDPTEILAAITKLPEGKKTP